MLCFLDIQYIVMDGWMDELGSEANTFFCDLQYATTPHWVFACSDSGI